MIKATIKDITNLRSLTGAGLMDCKKAFEEASGDVDKAIIILRSKCVENVEKKINREVNEGRVMALVNDSCNFGTIFLMRCETDFASNSFCFSSFIEDVCKNAVENKIKKIEDLKLDNNVSFDDALLKLKTSVKENVCIEYHYIEGEKIAYYNHFNKKISVLLSLKYDEGADHEIVDEAVHDVCLQIAAMNPLALKREDISAEIINREKLIAEEKYKDNGKKKEIIDNIINGVIEKFYKENVLLEQTFIKDNKIIIKDFLKKNNITIIEYKRISI